ncbi:MAG: vWA domain-containing protein, partial [Bacteroidia bacterium]
RLEIPFGKGIETANPIKKRIKSLEPMGTTPIAYSIGQAAYDFPKADDYRNLILLITDGLEECQGNPCYISQELQNKGIITKPYIIGLNVPLQDQAQLGCIGRYFNADAPDAFLPAMYAAFSDMAFATTAQVFLLDEQQQPTESDVLMTFTDEQGYERYNWIHSLNALGTPDT